MEGYEATITVRVHNLHTLINIDCIHYCLALLMFLFLGDLVALLALLVMACFMRVMMNSIRLLSNSMRVVLSLSVFLLRGV